MTTKLKGSQIKVEDIVSNPATLSAMTSTTQAPSENAVKTLIGSVQSMIVTITETYNSSLGRTIYTANKTVFQIYDAFMNNVPVYAMFQGTVFNMNHASYWGTVGDLHYSVRFIAIDPLVDDAGLMYSYIGCNSNSQLESWTYNIINVDAQTNS